jgi:predicted DNA-binding protein
MIKIMEKLRAKNARGQRVYVDQGKETSKPGSRSFSVRFPVELSEFLDGMPPEGRADFVREAVRAKLNGDNDHCLPIKRLLKTFSVRFPPDLVERLKEVDVAAFIRTAVAEKKASL